MSEVDKSNVLLSIAICTYNRDSYLRDTLADLAHQNSDFQSVEFLVINNNSTDDTQKVLVEAQVTYPQLSLKVVNESMQGLSHARNRALTESKSKFILYIDDDVYLSRDFINNWMSFLLKNDISAGGGPIDVHFDDGQPDWFPMLLSQMLGYHRPFKSVRLYPQSGYPHGGNMVVNREIAQELGGFDTRLGRIGKNLAGGEEKDFFNRLKTVYKNVYYNPSSSLKHRIGKERLTKEFIRKQAIGIGHSDRVSTESMQKALKWLFNQAFKFVASIIFAVGYLVTFRPKQAWYLIRFRFWVMQGFYQVITTQTSSE